VNWRSAREQDCFAGGAERPVRLEEQSRVAGKRALTSPTTPFRERNDAFLLEIDRVIEPSWLFSAERHDRPSPALRWLRRTSRRSCTMRTDPTARTNKAPSATAASSATPIGSVLDRVTKLTFAVRRFCKTNSRVAVTRTRAGKTASHARPARVVGITFGSVDAFLPVLSALPAELSWAPGGGELVSSAAEDLIVRVPIGTPNPPPMSGGAVARA
jgi:hypothetical protein